MRIDPNIRITVLGMTQSGKSYFVKNLLKSYSARLIYDIKGEYKDFGVVVHDLKSLRETFLSGCDKVVYHTENLSFEHFDEVCKFVYMHLKNIVFVVDEAHNFCSKAYIPEYFKRIITVCQGVPYKIGVIAVSQRGQNLHNDILGNSTVWRIFQVERLDAEYLSKRIKVSSEELENLPPHHSFTYNNRAGGQRLFKNPPI